MHDAYIRGVKADVFATKKKNKCGVDANAVTIQSSFALYSPMAVSSMPRDVTTFLENLNSFWAVLRCGRDPSHKPNMDMLSVTLELARAKGVEGVTLPYNMISTRIEFPVFTKWVPLKMTELLTANCQGGSAVIQ